MADNSFFNRLRRLFSTNVIVRSAGRGRTKVVDTDRTQAYKGLATNFAVDRYSRLHGSNMGGSKLGYDTNQNFMAARLALFNDYEEMDLDPIIASALDVYADESTMKNEFDEVL